VPAWVYFFLSALFGCFGFLGVFAFLSIANLLEWRCPHPRRAAER
jgi:hypothetical protein